MKSKIGDLTKIRTGKLDANASTEDGQYPFFTCSREPLKISTYSYDCECVLVAGNGDLNVKYYNGKFDAYQRTYIIEDNGSGKLLMPYLYYFMERYVEELRKQAIGGVIKYIKLGNLTDALIELPSVDEQKAIVDILVKIKNVLDMRNEEISKLDDLIKARFVELFGDPKTNPKGYTKITVEEAIEAGYIEKPFDGNHGSKHPKASEYVEEGIPFLMANNVIGGTVDQVNCSFITEERANKLDKGFAKDNDVLITHKGTIGRTAVLRTDYEFVMLTPQVAAYRVKRGITSDYLCGYFGTDFFQNDMKVLAAAGGSTRAYAGITAQLQLHLIIPPLDEQKVYTDFIHQVDKSKVADNFSGINS